MKIKHSKFKNTGILFELLVRQIASDTVSNKDSAAIGLVKKYFSKSELAKEYKLYQALITPKNLTEAKAETFINSTLEASLRLNKTALRKEKYNIIKEIREHYDLEEFFKAKINNYKQYAAAFNLIITTYLADSGYLETAQERTLPKVTGVRSLTSIVKRKTRLARRPFSGSKNFNFTSQHSLP